MAQPEPNSTATRRSRNIEGTETVLVVEDDPAVREYASHVLKSRGYKLLDASNGVEAIAIVEQKLDAVDIIVTDVKMPEMGGVELARRLRDQRGDVKVLFMSGYVGAEFMVEESVGPNSDFVQKPFAPAVLCAKVRALLDAP